jgi:hypothetical protein
LVHGCILQGAAAQSASGLRLARAHMTITALRRQLATAGITPDVPEVADGSEGAAGEAASEAAVSVEFMVDSGGGDDATAPGAGGVVVVLLRGGLCCLGNALALHARAPELATCVRSIAGRVAVVWQTPGPPGEMPRWCRGKPWKRFSIAAFLGPQPPPPPLHWSHFCGNGMFGVVDQACLPPPSLHAPAWRSVGPPTRASAKPVVLSLGNGTTYCCALARARLLLAVEKSVG